MTTAQELKKINDEHFKGRTNPVRFCEECDLKEKLYCIKCANKSIKRQKEASD